MTEDYWTGKANRKDSNGAGDTIKRKTFNPSGRVQQSALGERFTERGLKYVFYKKGLGPKYKTAIGYHLIKK